MAQTLGVLFWLKTFLRWRFKWRWDTLWYCMEFFRL